MTGILMNSLMAAVMTVCSVVDIKKKEISICFFVLLGIISSIGCFLNSGKISVMTILGVVPGMLLMVIAKITDQCIGYGDGIILAEIGLLTGVGKCMLILALALAVAGVFSLGIVVVKRVNRKYKIPFVPFLTIAYLLVLCLQI